MRHLRGRGFTEAELTLSGLVSQGQRGVYDRFRGRLVWPIREVTGETVGFGARHLFEEDQGPKYLNTPETPLYKKSQVLYGIDLAKRDLQRDKRVVVVEGYTDVMAMHLSGVGTAVATCGTAFGSDHARIVRRLIGDSGSTGGVQLASGASVGGEIIFTFDGDAAGQKAALRAFGEDQSFSAQTFVAVEKSGMDPCELRQAKGPDAVRALVAGRTPLYEFVIRSTLASYDLRTAEGRIGALRAAAPIVAGIRDAGAAPRVHPAAVRLARASTTRTRCAGRCRARRTSTRTGAASAPSGPPSSEPVPVPVARMPVPDRRDPVAQIERTALEVVLQRPDLVAADFDELPSDAFGAPAYRAVHEAIRAAGGLTVARPLVQASGGSTGWVGAVIEEAAEPVRALVTELAVAPLPEDRPESLEGYVKGVVLRLVEIGFTRHIADLRGRLQRMDAEADPAAYQAAFAELVEVEGRRRNLRESA